MVQSTTKRRGTLQVEGPADDRFGDSAPAVRRLQSGLAWSVTTEGKYLASLQTEVTDYFATAKGIWVNGLDGEQSVEETVTVFESPADALCDIWRWRHQDDAVALRVFVLRAKETELTAVEVFRVAETATRNSVGPVLSSDPAIATTRITPHPLSDAQRRVVALLGKGRSGLPGADAAVIVDGTRVCHMDTLRALANIGVGVPG